MPRLVVADIDNTLVKRHGDMSSYTKDTINKLHQNNILFMIASGRPYCQVEPLIDGWGVYVNAVISANGCELIDLDDNTTSYYHMMKPEWFKQTIELMKPFKSNAMMVIDDVQHVEYIDQEVIESCKYMNKKPVVISNISDYYITNSKIMFRVDPKDMDECERYVNAHPSKYWKGFKTQPFLMEFANINVSKAYSLKQYCLKKDIDLKDVWAFGDTTNDNDMLIASGRGVCMLNGSNDTKNVADDITKKECKDDGFADYIERKVFKNE